MDWIGRVSWSVRPGSQPLTPHKLGGLAVRCVEDVRPTGQGGQANSSAVRISNHSDRPELLPLRVSGMREGKEVKLVAAGADKLLV